MRGADYGHIALLTMHPNRIDASDLAEMLDFSRGGDARRDMPTLVCNTLKSCKKSKNQKPFIDKADHRYAHFP